MSAERPAATGRLYDALSPERRATHDQRVEVAQQAMADVARECGFATFQVIEQLVKDSLFVGMAVDLLLEERDQRVI